MLKYVKICTLSIKYALNRNIFLLLLDQIKEIMKSILTYVLTLIVTVSTFAEISISEKKALLQLNKSTNGDQWSTKWDLNAPVVTWYGVTIQNDKVVAIDLSSNKLSGKLPSEVSNLIYLNRWYCFKTRYLVRFLQKLET